jgi:hypothetical protein
MNHLHTHSRRLVAALLLVGGMGVVLALTHSARSASLYGSSANGYTVSYYHQTKFLGSKTIANGGGIDVVWRDSICSNGYGSPPIAFTWSGASTGAASAPLIGPCGTAPGASRPKGPDDLRCTFDLISPFIHCSLTYKASDSSSATAAKIANPVSGSGGSLYLYKRTLLYAYLITPGKADQKIAVPAGADTVKFTPSP